MKALPWLPKIVSKQNQCGDLLSETICRPKGLYSNRRHSSNTGEDDATLLTVTCTCTEPRLPLSRASPTNYLEAIIGKSHVLCWLG
jgi:hypothetical protein